MWEKEDGFLMRVLGRGGSGAAHRVHVLFVVLQIFCLCFEISLLDSSCGLISDKVCWI